MTGYLKISVLDGLEDGARGLKCETRLEHISVLDKIHLVRVFMQAIDVDAKELNGLANLASMLDDIVEEKVERKEH